MTEYEQEDRSRHLVFPWGRIGPYLAGLFWLVAAMTGALAYDTRPSVFTVVACAVFFVGTLICGGKGIATPGWRNRIYGVMALVILFGPFVYFALR